MGFRKVKEKTAIVANAAVETSTQTTRLGVVAHPGSDP
jgi:hypothetical protein